MDGPPSVVACPIPPGEQFTYEFHIEDPGTYWWHAVGVKPDFECPLVHDTDCTTIAL